MGALGTTQRFLVNDYREERSRDYYNEVQVVLYTGVEPKGE